MTNLFLHVYPGGDNCLPVLLNSFVHMLMYTHYLCSVLGVKCWWRSILTKLQLVQFVLITVINVADLVKCVFKVSVTSRGGCQEPMWMNWILIGYMATMIVLFSQFYVRRYLWVKKELLRARSSSESQNKPKMQ